MRRIYEFDTTVEAKKLVLSESNQPDTIILKLVYDGEEVAGVRLSREVWMQVVTMGHSFDTPFTWADCPSLPLYPDEVKDNDE